MCIWQTGVVVEIFCGEVRRTGASDPISLLISETLRIPYVKYSTGANKAICFVYRALGKPDWTAARRAFLTGRIIGEWHAEAKCFFRRDSAIPRLPRSFLPYLFCQDRKDMARGAADAASQTAARLRRIRNAPFAQNKKPPDGMSGGIFIVCLMQTERFAQLILRKPS